MTAFIPCTGMPTSGTSSTWGFSPVSLDVGPGEDGDYGEAYEGADVVFPGANEDIVRVVLKTPAAQLITETTLEALKRKEAA